MDDILRRKKWEVREEEDGNEGLNMIKASYTEILQ
jgi:hypothetical protein